LCDGISDLFEENGLKIFGPVKEAAEFENYKIIYEKFLENTTSIQLSIWRAKILMSLMILQINCWKKWQSCR